MVRPLHARRGEGDGGSRGGRLNQEALSRLRAICLALPGASERLSHGTPTWFAGGRQFAQIWDNHHEDGLLALWCAAPEGVQSLLVEANPELFYVPPYVGNRGWLGVRLDRRPDWEEIAGVVANAHRVITEPRPRRTKG